MGSGGTEKTILYVMEPCVYKKEILWISTKLLHYFFPFWGL